MNLTPRGVLQLTFPLEFWTGTCTLGPVGLSSPVYPTVLRFSFPDSIPDTSILSSPTSSHSGPRRNTDPGLTTPSPQHSWGRTGQWLELLCEVSCPVPLKKRHPTGSEDPVTHEAVGGRKDVVVEEPSLCVPRTPTHFFPKSVGATRGASSESEIHSPSSLPPPFPESCSLAGVGVCVYRKGVPGTEFPSVRTYPLLLPCVDVSWLPQRESDDSPLSPDVKVPPRGLPFPCPGFNSTSQGRLGRVLEVWIGDEI